MVYVVLGFDLWMKMRWGLPRMLLLMFFGVVPVLSFFGERWTHQRVGADLARRPTIQDQEAGSDRRVTEPLPTGPFPTGAAVSGPRRERAQRGAGSPPGSRTAAPGVQARR